MSIGKMVKVKWHSTNRRHYESKGYVFTKIGDEFSVRLIDKPITPRILKLRKEGKTLKDIYPHIALQWSDKNDLTPYDYSPFSNEYVWWKCSNNPEHEWCSGIRTVVSALSNGCPYCDGKKICVDNCLATTHPDLSKQWHPTKNGELTPYDVTYGSNKIFWWIGECGHEWDTPIKERSKGIGCPYCDGRRVDITNCLATVNPKLALEWDENKNIQLSPYDVVPNSAKRVWWICSNCNHSWETVINSRNKGTGCPVCKESKGEKRIRDWLENNGIYFISQKEFTGLIGIGGGNLRFDFYLPKQNLLIEYQGEFHDGSNGTDMISNLEIQQEHDERKHEFAEQNNFKLFEIWYWDFEKIEEILKDIIN